MRRRRRSLEMRTRRVCRLIAPGASPSPKGAVHRGLTSVRSSTSTVHQPPARLRCPSRGRSERLAAPGLARTEIGIGTARNPARVLNVIDLPSASWRLVRVRYKVEGTATRWSTESRARSRLPRSQTIGLRFLSRRDQLPSAYTAPSARRFGRRPVRPPARRPALSRRTLSRMPIPSRPTVSSKSARVHRWMFGVSYHS